MDEATLRGLWLAIGLLTALIIATGAGVLTNLSGVHPAKAVIAAGAAFGSSILVIIAVFTYLQP